MITKKNHEYWDMLTLFILDEQTARCEKNISLEELSKKSGISVRKIERFENLGYIPTYDFIVRLSDAIGMKPEIQLKSL